MERNARGRKLLPHSARLCACSWRQLWRCGRIDIELPVTRCIATGVGFGALVRGRRCAQRAERGHPRLAPARSPAFSTPPPRDAILFQREGEIDLVIATRTTTT